jgi:23S rRNA pseudouridine2604 synthase
MTDTPNDSTVRLAKRVAEMLPCSRREAELYIEGGWVSVDGQLVEEAGARVAPAQVVLLADGAKAVEMPPVTILLHKPAGVNGGIGHDGKAAISCLGKDTLYTPETVLKPPRVLARHFASLTLTNPLETAASGLLILTQDYRVARKLVDEAARVEQEFIVEVAGQIGADGLALLNHGLPFNGKPLPPCKVSWQNETKLRFALKGVLPGQIEHMCRMVGLQVLSMKRLRVGRISMAALAPGQWRYLAGYERF